MNAALPPLSCPLLVSDVPQSGRRDHILATKSERVAVAKALGVSSVKMLDADLLTCPFGNGGLIVEGIILADIVQTCVISLEDFETRVTAPVLIRFAPDGVDPNAAVGLQILIEEGAEEPPDLLINGKIDLGAIVTEFLTLALDPYPRKPGVVFSGYQEDASASPFETLVDLKKTK